MKRQIKADLRELVDAFETCSDEMPHYLDLQTGEIEMISEADRSALRDYETYLEEEQVEEANDATFEAWLSEAGLPDWQIDSVRRSRMVDEDFGSRFISIPEQDSREGYRDMSAFAETVANGHLQQLLDVALNGKGAFRRFKDVLCDFPEERERWFEFEHERSKERVMEWLEDQELELEK